MSPNGPVPVFSSSMLASETAPKSHPVRVNGTHGAGVVELKVDDVLDGAGLVAQLAPPSCCTRRRRRPGRHRGRDDAGDRDKIGQLATETRLHHTTPVSNWDRHTQPALDFRPAAVSLQGESSTAALTDRDQPRLSR